MQGDSRSLEAGWIDRLCHGSEKAGLLRGVRAFHASAVEPFDFRTLACSGAEVGDGFIGAQSDPPEAGAPVDPQLEQLERWMHERGATSVDVVVISVEGNDAGFARRIADCVLGELVEDIALNLLPFNCGLDADFREAIRTEPDVLPQFYEDLAARLNACIRVGCTFGRIQTRFASTGLVASIIVETSPIRDRSHPAASRWPIMRTTTPRG